MKEFCGDDVEVCQPSVGGLLAACVLFQWQQKYRRNYIVRKPGNYLNNHEFGRRVYIYTFNAYLTVADFHPVAH